MAIWKRLKRMDQDRDVDVNMDAVIHIERFKDHTTVYFNVSPGDHIHTVLVKETPDEIHLKSTLPQAE
jgi:hypothetical protein